MHSLTTKHNVIFFNIVTKEMVEEEERVYRAALAEEKVVRQKVRWLSILQFKFCWLFLYGMKRWLKAFCVSLVKFMADLQTLQRDNFYFHLKNLLDRSFWYTSSLHRRIMEENEQETSENTGKETNKVDFCFALIGIHLQLCHNVFISLSFISLFLLSFPHSTYSSLIMHSFIYPIYYSLTFIHSLTII